MNRRIWAISAVALAVGVIAGRFLGRGGAQGPGTGTANAALTSPPVVATTQAFVSAFGEENKSISRVFAALQGSDSEARSGLYEAIQQLTPEELEKVRQMLKRMPASFANQLRPSLLEQWARQNPAEAAMRVREMPESARFNDRDGVAAAWALTSPELALDEAARLGMNSGKATFLRRAAIESLGRRDPSVAMDHVEALLDCPERDSLLSMTAIALARKDAAAASNWLASRLPKLKVGAEGSELVNGTLAAIAGKDPERAKAQVASLPELLRGSAASAVGTEIVNYDPRAGLQYCADNGLFTASDNRNSGRYDDPFETAVRRDREQTVAWTLEQPAGAMRDYGLSRLMRGSKDAEEVSKHFALMTPEAQSQNVDQAVQSYGAYAKFDEAVRWVEGMGDEAMRARGTVALINSKGGANSTEILGWLEKMPAGSAREDGAMTLFVAQEQISYQTPGGTTPATSSDTTNKILAMISDPDKRQQAAMQGYYRHAYGRPELVERANAWLDALPSLTAEQKAQIKKNAPLQLQIR
jgi:hypothetical protein